MEEIANKLNWIPFKQWGSYYKFQDNVLWYAPMNKDGTMDFEAIGEVEHIDEGEKNFIINGCKVASMITTIRS